VLLPPVDFRRTNRQPNITKLLSSSAGAFAGVRWIGPGIQRFFDSNVESVLTIGQLSLLTAPLHCRS
jgi:hypothetical protein